MTSKISLDYLRAAVSEKERIEDTNEVFLLFLLETALNVNQILNSAASLLKNAVYEEKGKSNKLVIAIDPLDDLKEQSDVFFSLFFL